jgi:4-hydroxybenzoate polyprenyltransferase
MKFMASVEQILWDHAAPTERTFRNKIIGLVALLRIMETSIGFLFVIAAAALAGESFRDSRFPFLLIAAWFILAASMIVNDIADAERDKQRWPLRPLANGLLSKSEATLYATILAGIGLVIAGVVYNWLFAALSLVVIVLSYVYARTRKKIGYLTILPCIAFVPVAVWVAISPATVFTPLFWLAIAIYVVEMVAINTINEALDTENPVLFIQLQPRMEKALYVASVSIMFFLGIAIFYYAELPLLYLPVLGAITLWGFTAVKYFGKKISMETLKKTGFLRVGVYSLIYLSSIAIFLWMK